MTRTTIAAAMLALAWPSLAQDAIRDPFIERLPKTEAQFGEMWNEFVRANKGARDRLGSMADVWRVVDMTNNEAEEAVWFTPGPDSALAGRQITWSGHGWSLTVRDTGAVVESKGGLEQHIIRNGW